MIIAIIFLNNYYYYFFSSISLHLVKSKKIYIYFLLLIEKSVKLIIEKIKI